MPPSTIIQTSESPRNYRKARHLAARFGVCSKTIFRWADEGKINRFKINERVVLFDETEVISFIEGTRVGVARSA